MTKQEQIAFFRKTRDDLAQVWVRVYEASHDDDSVILDELASSINGLEAKCFRAIAQLKEEIKAKK